MPEHKVLEAAIKHYGATSQVVKLFEEMSELQKELCKNFFGRDNLHEIAEEIADVQIMLKQMILLYNCQELVTIYRCMKVDRLQNKLAKEMQVNDGT